MYYRGKIYDNYQEYLEAIKEGSQIMPYSSSQNDTLISTPPTYTPPTYTQPTYTAPTYTQPTYTTSTSTETLTDTAIESERKKYYVRGLSGLKNQGNTCYMNSVLQCLSSIDIFRAYLIEGKYADRLYYNVLLKLGDEKRKKESIPDDVNVKIPRAQVDNKFQNTIVSRLAELLKIMWEQNVTVNPKSFKKVAGENCSLFSGYAQNDSQELLNLILDRIHEETKSDSIKIKHPSMSDGVKNYLQVKSQCVEKTNDEMGSPEEKQKYLKYLSEYTKTHITDSIISESYLYWKKFISSSHSVITNLFSGLYYSKITCSECKSITNSFEPFTMMSLETKENGETTLEESLKSFVNDELLTGDNQYFCCECQKKVDATKKMHIWAPPNVLVIQLKRFKNDKHIATKTSSKVVFPIENLDLKDYMSELFTVDKTKYDLVAISEHRGSCNCGHYVAYSRNSINNEWYEFNDDDIFRVPYDELAKEIITKNAYLLFYVRKLD